MYTGYPYNYYNRNDRLAGGFLGPFILGGITGGLLAPTFYRPNNYYCPYPNCYYFGGYYR